MEDRSERHVQRARCRHHPRRRARWRCHECRRNLCPQCRTPPRSSGQAPSCPDCETRLTRLGMETAVPRFWQRPWQLLAYPLHLGPALHLVSFAGMTFIGILPLLGWAFFLLAWFLFLRYALETLMHTAQGHVQPTETRLLEAGLPLVSKTALLLTALPAAGLLAMDHLGSGPSLVLGMALGVVLLICLPLMLMRLGMEQSLLAALNPFGWPIPILRLGRSYWLMLLFLALLAGVTVLLSRLLIDSLPVYFILPPMSLVQMYFLLVGFHLIGYVIFQHHDRLDVQVRETVLDELERSGPA